MELVWNVSGKHMYIHPVGAFLCTCNTSSCRSYQHREMIREGPPHAEWSSIVTSYVILFLDIWDLDIVERSTYFRLKPKKICLLPFQSTTDIPGFLEMFLKTLIRYMEKKREFRE